MNVDDKLLVLFEMSITVYYGPMFSGKTTRLIQLIDKYSCDKIMVYKHVMDDRYIDDSNIEIASHDGEKRKATVVSWLPHKNEVGIFPDELQYSRYVFIDEGHFFENIVDFCNQLKSHGKHVFVSAVDKVFTGNYFENIFNLLKIADFTHHKQGVCAYENCDKSSTNTHINKKYNDGHSTIVVGGSEKYEPLCYEHFVQRALR